MSSQFDNLLLSAEFQSLLRSKKRFNLFKSLGVQRKELVHSKLLAFFFNPKATHGCGNSIVKAFLQNVVAFKQSDFTLAEFLTIDFSVVIVKTEHYCIDLVLKFPLSKTVIAIENKIMAGEAEQQISNYQQKIEEHYEHYNMCKILFLTPKGVSSLTKKSESKVACVPVSYRCVSHALKNVKHLLAQEVINFFEQTILHIEDTILNEGEGQQLINKIWANSEYAETLQVLLKKRPKLESIRKEYQTQIEALCKHTWNLKANFTTHTKRGVLREIKFQFEKWNDKDLPITFMFYQYDDNPAFRVLVSEANYKEHKNKLDDFAKKSNTFAKILKFTVIEDWEHWRNVYAEDYYPEATYYDQLICDSDTLEWAVEQATEHVNKLKPLVENFKV